MSVIVKELTKSYGSQRAIDAISFELKKGEVVGFIGPNGSGKSTTMKCICGILSGESGTIEVAGKDISRDLHLIKQKIGYLPENNPLYTEMYIKEYLEHIAGYYFPHKVCMLKVNQIVEATGLAPEQHKKIGQLSKGYKQRVGLAQAMIHNPEILILDEPTTGLDPNQLVEIRNLISGLSKDKTVLLSTHILQEVEAICDRVIIINHGKIVADNTSKHIRSTTLSGTQTLHVEFNARAEINDLLKIDGIFKAERVSENEFLLEGDGSKDLRESIFNFAIDQKLKLLTLQKKDETLEQAFRKLTSGK
jgi:ABC-2 type transport system ATP-binding protein